MGMTFWLKDRAKCAWYQQRKTQLITLDQQLSMYWYAKIYQIAKIAVNYLGSPKDVIE